MQNPFPSTIAGPWSDGCTATVARLASDPPFRYHRGPPGIRAGRSIRAAAVARRDVHVLPSQARRLPSSSASKSTKSEHALIAHTTPTPPETDRYASTNTNTRNTYARTVSLYDGEMRSILLFASLSPFMFLFAIPACVADDPSTGAGSTSDGGTDGSVASCTSPNAPSCGAHGKCNDTSGSAQCVCDPGFGGATCATACADGGTCTSGSKCAATTCGAHQTCDDSTGAPVCSCAVGYTGTTTCTWAGAPLDPGFRNTPANAWMMSSGSGRRRWCPHLLEPSAATVAAWSPATFTSHRASDLQRTANGTSSGRVEAQVIQMPAYAVAEPTRDQHDSRHERAPPSNQSLRRGER